MKTWTLRIIHYLTGFLVLSSLHCLVVGLVTGGDRATFIHSIIYLPVVILLSESQKKVKYAWQFLVCSVIAIMIARIAFDRAFEQTLSTVLTVAAILLFFYARAKKAECIIETPAYYFLVLYMIMWFLERQYPSELLTKYAVTGAGIYYLLCMLKTNVDELIQFIDLHENLERFPEKRLVKSNLLMMGFQTVVVGSGMGIALSTRADGIFHRLAEGLQRFMRWLLQFLETEEQHAGSEVTGGSVVMPPIEAEETSAFMEMLLKFLDFLSWIFVIGITLYAIYKILKKFYQLYLEFDQDSVDNGDEIEHIYAVQSKEEKRKIRQNRTGSIWGDRSPNARIRKHYKKRILQGRKEIPQPFLTPFELESTLEMEESKKERFHQYYEKARYGNVPCSKEEQEQCLRL